MKTPKDLEKIKEELREIMLTLGDRIKDYESVSKSKLMKRTPVIIRLDGCHFHTFTKCFDKPFDNILVETMQETMQYLCQKIQGCVLGYTQSDEITLVLVDYKNLNTSPWFDYEVQKLCSVSASMCSMFFNKTLKNKIEQNLFTTGNAEKYNKTMDTVTNGAYFDARVFNVPIDEVLNAVLFRQNDCTRNSIFALASSYFCHKQLQGKNGNEMQEMLFQEHGVNWNDLPTHLKRGSCCIKNNEGKWFIDNEIPIFKGEGKDYIEKLIKFE